MKMDVSVGCLMEQLRDARLSLNSINENINRVLGHNAVLRLYFAYCFLGLAEMDSTPICRCRVLYLGSAVPRQSKDGLQGIQEPLQSLYPAEGAVGAKGIDSWLSVWSNGILLENVDENLKQITRFFPIESLHYCAAVRQVLVLEREDSSSEPKFLPLDSPFARMPRDQHPPIFSAILRRTTGIKVLECHVFICKREAAANALVRCCFHAYADNSYFRQLETSSSAYGTSKKTVGLSKSNGDLTSVGLSNTGDSQSARLHTGFDHLGNTISSNCSKNGLSNNINYSASDDGPTVAVGRNYPLINGNENHKIWNGSNEFLDSNAFESSYEFLAVNTSSMRPTRARQISASLKVSPPPTTGAKKNKKKNTFIGRESLSGSLIEPINHSQFLKPIMYTDPVNAFFEPVNDSKKKKALIRRYHTISHRKLPLSSTGQMYPIPLQTHMPSNTHQSSKFPLKVQVPFTMPQHIATLLSPRTAVKNNNTGFRVSVPIVPSLCTIPVPTQTDFTQSLFSDSRPLAILSRKQGLSVCNELKETITESSNGSGIYRRKGHLNERAFSYSIRQEHRSRSHGSLASLKFQPTVMQTVQDIEEMVDGLELKHIDDNTLDKWGN